MKQFKKVLLLVISFSFIILPSCNIEKRIYLSGYHIEWKNARHKRIENTIQKKDINPEIKLESENKKVFENTRKQIYFNHTPQKKMGDSIITTSRDNDFIVSEPLFVLTKKDPKSIFFEQNVVTRKKIFRKVDFYFLFAAGILGFLSLRLFKPFISRSKKIALWAKVNKQKAQGIIFVSQLLVGFGGFLLGTELHSIGYSLSQLSVAVLLSCTAFITFISSLREKLFHKIKANYQTKKNKIFILGLLGFLLMISVGNISSANNRAEVSALQKNELSKRETINKSPDQNNVHDLISKNKHSDNSRKSLDKPLRILLTLLTLFFMFILLLLVSILACHFSCGGQNVLGGAIYIGGWTGIITLTFFVMKLIWKGSESAKLESK